MRTWAPLNALKVTSDIQPVQFSILKASHGIAPLYLPQMNINIEVHRPGATTVFKDPNLHTNSSRKSELQMCIQGQGNLGLKSKVALGLHGHYGNVEVNQGCR